MLITTSDYLVPDNAKIILRGNREKYSKAQAQEITNSFRWLFPDHSVIWCWDDIKIELYSETTEAVKMREFDDSFY